MELWEERVLLDLFLVTYTWKGAEWQSGHFLHIHGTVLPGSKRKHFCGTVSWEEGFYNLVGKEEIKINET